MLGRNFGWSRCALGVLWLALAGLSCAMDTGIGPSEGPTSVFDEIFDERILEIPTYDGSGQAVHPDVVYARCGCRGPLFYMAMTPYPFGNNAFENPSILVSEDGVAFYEQEEGLNPLVGPPAYDHNNDPDLLFADQAGAFYLYYLETMRPDSQNVVLLRSTDAVFWQRQTVLHYDLGAGDDFILSPAVLKVGSGYWMYYVNLSLPGHPIEFLTSQDGVHWGNDSPQTITADYPDGLVPWHIDVFEGGGRNFMLCCGPYNDMDLYLATSADLVSWDFGAEPLLRHSASFYNSERIYRSTGVVDGDLLVVWFSFRDLDGEWHIGVKKFRLRDVA